MHAASGVMCSSRWAAAELSRRYGRDDVGVAIPGVTPAAVAHGSLDSGPPRFLSVASLTPTKDQLTLAHALAQLADLPWTADLIGSDRPDPEYATRLRSEIVAAGLAPSIQAAMGASRTETYGLVVVEALARGIPAVVSAGTGAIEALQEGATKHSTATPGTSVPAGDSASLAAVLRRWLTEPMLRRAWRQAALARRDTLPGWQQTAEAVLGYLNRPRNPPSIRPGLPPAPPLTPPPGPPPSTASSPN